MFVHISYQRAKPSLSTHSTVCLPLQKILNLSPLPPLLLTPRPRLTAVVVAVILVPIASPAPHLPTTSPVYPRRRLPRAGVPAPRPPSSSPLTARPRRRPACADVPAPRPPPSSPLPARPRHRSALHCPPSPTPPTRPLAVLPVAGPTLVTVN
jgi:hypothetical protein